jgi:hypothetical protein
MAAITKARPSPFAVIRGGKAIASKHLARMVVQHETADFPK